MKTFYTFLTFVLIFITSSCEKMDEQQIEKLLDSGCEMSTGIIHTPDVMPPPVAGYPYTITTDDGLLLYPQNHSSYSYKPTDGQSVTVYYNIDKWATMISSTSYARFVYILYIDNSNRSNFISGI